MISRFLLLVSLALGSGLAPVQGQHRVPERPPDHRQRQVRPPRPAITRNVPMLRKFVAWQKGFQQYCIASLREFKNRPSLVQVLVLLGIALGYGAVHALGPGHGKLVLSACVIGRHYSLKNALKGSLLFSLVHNGIPVILYIVFLLILKMLRYRHTHLLTAHLYRVSGILLAGLGLGLLVSVIMDRKKGDPQPRSATRLQRVSLPLACAAAGLVPCPGTLLILFFAGTLGVPLMGFAMAGAFFTGMLLTLSGFALLVTSGRNYVTARSKINPWIDIVRVVGPACLVLIGLYMVVL